MQLLAYSDNFLQKDITKEEKIHVETMLTSMQMGYMHEAIDAYEKWITIVNS